ncbi:MAG TPA: branched-chain amino acid ABC transporter permease [Burkholderiales bacterium]|nr:branched-chain amino acid ABC transporter permease [Burkholderiales bacterium]
MRFLFKTDYDQDLRLFKHGGQGFWYGLLFVVLLAAPWWASEYMMTQLHFIGIYSIVGLGLMLLVGFTGQISLGHAAFLAVGAYTEALLAAAGWPFWLSLPCAALLSAAVGIVVGLPALRLKGIYLAIATLAFGVIAEEIAARWESLTGGNSGLHVKPIQLFGATLDGDADFYYLVLALTALCCIALANLLRSPTGRAFVAIRDSEISAACMGVNLARYKTLSFALSAALTGVGGALYAHKVSFISPEQFTLLVSIELVTLVILGGVGSLHGAVFGAAFIIVLPQLIAIVKDYLPAAVAGAAGLQSTVFGLVLIGFIIFEPMGLYGRWLKIRTWFELFPFYRKGMFRRQKTYMKSERLR